MGGAGESFDEKVESLAKKLLHDPENDLNDMETARRAASRMIQDSEERTAHASGLDPDDDTVIRRSSSETAAIGDTGPMRRVSDGE